MDVTYLGVAVAGALGAPARYLVDGWVQRRTDAEIPVGTMAVNLSGSFLLGLLAGLVLHHGFPHTPQVLLGAGFCGAYTTFSTFMFETVRLTEERARFQALVYLAVSLGGGLAAAALGLALGGR